MKSKAQQLTEAEKSQRREDFHQVNASLTLEGLEMDAEDLALQEKVTVGEMDHEAAIAIYRMKAAANGD